MKSLRSFSIIFFLASAIAFMGMAANATIADEPSIEYGVLAVLSLSAVAIAAAPKATFSLGLQMNRTEETLLEWLKNSGQDPDAFNKFAAGKLRFRDYSLYRAILVDGFSGRKKIWDATISEAVGVTNVDRAKLDKDVHVCVDRILIQYINSGGATTTPETIQGYDAVVTGWPAGLSNGEIHITQDGNPVLTKLMAGLCGSQADSQYGVGYADAYMLRTPFVLQGDKVFEVEIDFASQIAGANTDFIKVILMGTGTRRRGTL